MKTRHAGMTLLEILVVVGIIAVLASLLIPAIMAAQRKGAQATCLMNLQQIGMALIAYRQDTGAYPQPGKAIGALSSASPKLLPKVPTCPRDPVDNHDTYGALYNYWGYAVKTSPTPLQTEADAGNVYQQIQENSDVPAIAEKWADDKAYVFGKEVRYKTADYLCINHGGVPANDPTTTPYDGSAWKQYWQPTKLRLLWNFGHPDTDFPGLAKPNAPGPTIVTICPHHVNDIHNLLVLRVSGNAGTVPQQLSDKEFWALSKGK